jgi:hypothetical protein
MNLTCLGFLVPLYFLISTSTDVHGGSSSTTMAQEVLRQGEELWSRLKESRQNDDVCAIY